MRGENRRVSVLNERDMARAIRRITHQVVERNGGGGGLALVGVRTRGEPLARRLARHIGEATGAEVPVGVLDISLHRDDAQRRGEKIVLGETRIPFDVEGLHVVLVDDVLFTGRTVRAALDAIMELGRPRLVTLAVLVDRGHRELPFKADFVGKHLPTARREEVQVRLKEVDGEDRVVLERSPEETPP